MIGASHSRHTAVTCCTLPTQLPLQAGSEHVGPAHNQFTQSIHAGTDLMWVCFEQFEGQ